MTFTFTQFNSQGIGGGITYQGKDVARVSAVWFNDKPHCNLIYFVNCIDSHSLNEKEVLLVSLINDFFFAFCTSVKYLNYVEASARVNNEEGYLQKLERGMNLILRGIVNRKRYRNLFQKVLDSSIRF